MKKIPVNIISGFLGSGKTTAIIKLLGHKNAGEQWAIIVNEFGKISIDCQTLSSSSPSGTVYDISKADVIVFSKCDLLADESCEDYRLRVTMDPGPGYFRPITVERKAGINQFYEKTALSMYNGFSKRMAGYAEKGTVQQKRVAALFSDAQK